MITSVKKGILIIPFLFVILFSVAQDDASFSVPVGLMLKDLSADIPESAFSKIENKVQQILSRNGVSGEGWAQEFVVYPKLEVYDEAKMEGLQKLTLVKIEFSMYLKQTYNDAVFASVVHTITGSGSNKNAAINNAISTIQVNDTRYKNFIEQGKRKMLDFYNKNCNQFITKSKMLSQTQAYGEAMAHLLQIPVQAESCYSTAQQEVIILYKEWQKNFCQKAIQSAKASIAAMDFNTALEYLLLVDPESACFAEAQQLIKKIEDRVNEEYMRRWNFMVKVYDDSVALQKYRLDTCVRIMEAYAKKQPDNLYYNLIVR